jgi:phosphoserine phosphatase RsbU/P
MTFHSFLCTISLFAAGLYFLLGIIIFRDSPKRRINRVTGLLFCFAAIGFITGSFALTSPDVSVISWQDTFLGRFAWLWEFFFPVLVYFSFIFPRDSQAVKKHSRLVLILFIPYVFRFLLLAFFPDYQSLRSLLVYEVPEGLWGILARPPLFFLISMANFLEIFYQVHSFFFNYLNLIYIVIALSQISATYNSLHDQLIRRQIQPIILGVWMNLLIFSGVFLLPPIVHFSLNRDFCYVLISLAALLGAILVFYAIVRLKFLNIRFAAQKGLVFSMTTVLIIGGYLLIYGQTKRFLHNVIQTDLPVLELLFLLIAVYFFQPATDAIESLLDKFLSQRKDQRTALQRLSDDILSTSDYTIIGDRILNALTTCLGVHPVYMLVPNDKGVYTVQNAQDVELRALRFNREAEFIRAMENDSQPVKTESILKKIAGEEEKNELALLNAEYIVPIRHRGSLNGFLLVGSKNNEDVMSAHDLALLEMFALQFSIIIENTQLSELVRSQKYMEQELSVARQIQRMLLPSSVPKGKTFQIASFNIPSKEVGGDYHDFITSSAAIIGLAIGDIAGKGVPGSILMANLQACLRGAAPFARSASKVVGDVNKQLARSTTPDKYATFLYALYFEDRRILRYCNAGHNYPIWKQSSGDCVPVTDSGPIIGVDDSIVYQEFEILLNKDDYLVLYTDGITEALNMNVEEYGESRLLKVIKNYSGANAEGLRDHIYDEVNAFTGGTRQYDDMTLIVLHIL